jgi:hypothetical protein
MAFLLMHLRAWGGIQSLLEYIVEQFEASNESEEEEDEDD